MKSSKHLATLRYKCLAAVFAVVTTLGCSESAHATSTTREVKATFNGKAKLSFEYKCEAPATLWSHSVNVTRIKTNGDTVNLYRRYFSDRSQKSFAKIYEFDKGQTIKVKVLCYSLKPPVL